MSIERALASLPAIGVLVTILSAGLGAAILKLIGG
jgi:hypothetical protein